jgi:hypothetical protein
MWQLSVVGFALGLGTSHGWSERLVMKNGDVLDAEITEVKNGKAFIKLPEGKGTGAYGLDQITSVEMEAPAGWAELPSKPVAEQISILDGWLARYNGLPAAWVAEANVRMGAAKLEVGDIDAAQKVFDAMKQIYTAPATQELAQIGLAQVAQARGKTDDALRMVAPTVQRSVKVALAGREEGDLFANAFWVQGQAYEKSGKTVEAFESYLAIVSAFYQNPRLLAMAEAKVAEMRKANPKIAAN